MNNAAFAAFAKAFAARIAVGKNGDGSHDFFQV
jgi:hypothetical protein